jgi:cyanate permease
VNRGKAGFNRFITFLLFLVFAGLATWGIGLAIDWEFAHRIGEYADRDFWTGLPDRENYDDILRIAALVLFILGLVLLAVAVGTGQMWLYILAAVVSGIGQGMTLSRSVAAVSAAAQDVAERVSAVSLFYFLVYLLASVPVVLVGVVQRSAGLGTAAVAFSALSAVVVAVGVALAGRRL